MGRFVLSLVVLTCLSCTKNIGSIAFDETEERTFSIFQPDIGTFDFKQTYILEAFPNGISTSFRLSSETEDSIGYDIYGFKDDRFTFSNMVIASRGIHVANEEDHQEIDDNSGVLLDSQKIKLNVLNPDSSGNNRSGHYEGQVNLIMTGGVDPPNAIEIFNLFGAIDYQNRVLLFPTTQRDSIDYIEGQYNIENRFSGKVFYDKEQVGTLTNTVSNYSFQDGILKDVWSLVINNQSFQFDFTIQKTQL